ncbi:MAG: hypothetical protein PVH65_00215 [Chloroflexota bacterium]
MLETDVDSFILRFVQVRDAIARDATMPDPQDKQQDNGPTAVPWHGVIRHVQSKEEIRFTQIEDALRFVANYVQLTANIPTQDDSD